jgi:hypothetical protein
VQKPWIQRFPIEACDSHLARSVFLLLLAVFTATFNGLPGGIDGEVSFQSTSALARTGSCALSQTPESQGLIAEAESRPAGGFSVRGVGEAEERKHYGWFGIGMTISGLPFYALGRGMSLMSTGTQEKHREYTRFGTTRSEYYEHLFVGWRNGLLTALTACLLVLSARRLGVSRSAAFMGGMGYGLCTFALPQARGWFADVQGAFCMSAAFYSFLLLRDDWTAKRCTLLGASLAFAFLTRSSLAPAVLVFNLAFLWLYRATPGAFAKPGEGTTRTRSLLHWALPQVAALGLWMLANQLRFGHPLDSGYGQALSGGLFGGDPRTSVAGLLISPGKGLLWMAPGLLLLVFGVRRAVEEHELHLVWILGLASLAIFLPAAALVGWHGAWSFGPRYLLPALPLLWILAVLGFQQSPIEPSMRVSAWALLALGLMIQLPGTLVDTVTYHDLAVRASTERFEDLGLDEAATLADLQEARFSAMQFDWGFAGPWAQWRILRHRVALSSEDFPVREIFRFPSDLVLRPSQPREMGFRHMAWVDLRERLDGNIWLVVALITLLVLWGTADASRGLDP